MKYKFEEIAFNINTKIKPNAGDEDLYIGLEHLNSNNLFINNWGSRVALKGDKLLMSKGDILFGKRNAYLKRVGIAPFDGIFSAHGMIFRANEEVISKDFFPFFIMSDYFMDAAIKISVGSLSPTINWSDLKVLEFDLPSLVEQERLAKVLWETEEVKLHIKNQIYSNKNILKMKLLNFINNKSKMHPLKNIVKVINGVWVGKKEPLEKIFIIRNTNFTKDCRLDMSDIPEYLVESNKLKNKILKPGDIIIERSGGGPNQYVGRIVYFESNDEKKYTFSNFTSCLRNASSEILSKYIYIILVAHYFDGKTKIMQNQTTGICNLDMNQYLMLSIPMIDIKEQEAVIKLYDNHYKMEHQFEKSYKNYINIQKQILKEAFNV